MELTKVQLFYNFHVFIKNIVIKKTDINSYTGAQIHRCAVTVSISEISCLAYVCFQNINGLKV